MKDLPATRYGVGDAARWLHRSKPWVHLQAQRHSIGYIDGDTGRRQFNAGDLEHLRDLRDNARPPGPRPSISNQEKET
jgi:hypothetical protein